MAHGSSRPSNARRWVWTGLRSRLPHSAQCPAVSAMSTRGKRRKVAGKTGHYRTPIAELGRPVDARIRIPGIFARSQLRPAQADGKVPDRGADAGGGV